MKLEPQDVVNEPYVASEFDQREEDIIEPKSEISIDYHLFNNLIKSELSDCNDIRNQPIQNVEGMEMSDRRNLIVETDRVNESCKYTNQIRECFVSLCKDFDSQNYKNDSERICRTLLERRTKCNCRNLIVETDRVNESCKYYTNQTRECFVSLCKDLDSQVFKNDSKIICRLLRKRRTKCAVCIASRVNKSYGCAHCPAVFKRRNALKKHLAEHRGKKTPSRGLVDEVTRLSCDVCSYKCANKFRLVYHMRTHSSEKNLSCTLCDYKTNIEHYLVRHQWIHSKKTLLCSHCSYKTNVRHNLRMHQRIHAEKKHTCTQCGFRTHIRRLLVQHQVTHSAKQHMCGKCNYKTHYKCSLVRHQERHSMEKLHCSQCNYKTKAKINLHMHMLKHSEKQLMCGKCKYTTPYMSNFVRHQRKHAVKLLVCSHSRCNYSTRLKSRFVRHQEKHSETLHMCSQCNYTTLYKGSFVRHQHKHSTERFPCSQCDYETNSKLNLDRHLRKHSEQKHK